MSGCARTSSSQGLDRGHSLRSGISLGTKVDGTSKPKKLEIKRRAEGEADAWCHDGGWYLSH